MNNYNVVGLYDHNIKSYEKLKDGLKKDNIVAIVHATGTGKSYNAIQYLYDNKNKKALYLAPTNSIIEHIEKVIEENPNLDRKKDFPNLSFRTYQSLINLSLEEIKNLDIDILILDEFHHLGAPIWGKMVDLIIQTHPNIKVIGLTAYTVRDRNTSYERDMADTETDEIFSNKVVSRYDLCDALIDGILPKPIYKSAYVHLLKKEEYIENRLEKLDHNSKDYQELSKLLKDIKKRIHEALSIKDVFKQNIKKDGKYIYFCPVKTEKGVNEIEDIIKEAKNWLYEMGLTDNDFEFYITTSDMGKEGKENRQAFYNDLDLNGKKVDNKLRIMFAKNQYNEGVHAPRLDGVIMGRSTNSDIVFFEQLGRALSVRGDTKKEYDKLALKSIEELELLCKKRGIEIKENTEKEEMIERLLAPIIIDLVGNIDFIKELENNLKTRISEIVKQGNNQNRKIYIKDATFDIEMLNEDLYQIIKYVFDRLKMTWDDYYELAKKYYEHYGNLGIPFKFKTSDGINEDANGFIKLGVWLSIQRCNYESLSEEKKKKLEEIGFIKNLLEYKWNRNYELAKKYYEYYGNSDIRIEFKTNDGINYAENGEVKLGIWLSTQRYNYESLSEEKKAKLKEIGFIEDLYKNQWNRKYELAKKYYEYYGNSDISIEFKTNDGINHDENGEIKLGRWISSQRENYKNLSEEKKKKLEEIGFIKDLNDEQWNRNYEFAKKYYEYYGNLKISQDFKTNDGINYAENGKVKLGIWLNNQRYNYENLSEEKKKKLEEIGFIKDLLEDKWNRNYELAKKYYEHYGNLKISQDFKTNDGINYAENGKVKLGAWISRQRNRYKGKTGQLSLEKIELLNKIGMIWFTKNTDDKLQKEEITEKNIKAKQKEVLNRVITYLDLYDESDLPSKEDINDKFIDELNRKTK